MQIQEILSLSNLSESALDKILAHDRWKTEQQFAHEKWIHEFNAHIKNGSKPKIITSQSMSEDDVLINELTGYGELGEQHIGKLAKTPVYYAAENKALDVFYDWKKAIEGIDNLPKKDVADSRIKKLLTTFLWANSLAQRSAFWPDSKDIHYSEAAKRDIKQKLQSYSNVTIVKAYEAFKKFWREINDGVDIEFNSSFMADILDNAYEGTLKKDKQEKKLDIMNSPLFKVVKENHPHIPLDQLKKQIIAKRGDFISAILAIELKLFSKNVPDEYKDLYTKETWEQNYFKYVRKYDETWRKEYRSLYQSISKEQEQWKKESTS